MGANAAAARLVMALALLAWSAAGAFSSSGGRHVCSDASGTYRMDFESGSGELVEVGSSGKGDTVVAHRVMARLLVKDARSYCVSAQCGQRFPLQSREYLLRVEVRTVGTITLVCHDFWDGSPASCDCTREETIRNHAIAGWQAEERPGTLWNHNGSTMRLVADGASRVMSYERPRAGMMRVGVVEGTVLFNGVREGSTIRGKAHIFTPTCGVRDYEVSGSVQAGERRIELIGEVPLLDRTCRETGRRRDVLIFDLIGSGR